MNLIIKSKNKFKCLKVADSIRIKVFTVRLNHRIKVLNLTEKNTNTKRWSRISSKFGGIYIDLKKKKQKTDNYGEDAIKKYTYTGNNSLKIGGR